MGNLFLLERWVDCRIRSTNNKTQEEQCKNRSKNKKLDMAGLLSQKGAYPCPDDIPHPSPPDAESFPFDTADLPTSASLIPWCERGPKLPAMAQNVKGNTPLVSRSSPVERVELQQ